MIKNSMKKAIFVTLFLTILFFLFYNRCLSQKEGFLFDSSIRPIGGLTDFFTIGIKNLVNLVSGSNLEENPSIFEHPIS